MNSVIHILERKSVTYKLPRTVTTHARRSINKDRDIKSAGEVA